MSIRIGFDVDGVVADFAAGYRAVEQRLFGGRPSRADEPESEDRSQEHRETRFREAVDRPGETPAESHQPHEMRRRRDLIWKEIKQTRDFWATLAPIEVDGVRRIHQLMLRHRWEIFFITQRPTTAGDTVQRQTQRWLVEQGFDFPSVLVVTGSRGVVSSALRLSYHVDDNPQQLHRRARGFCNAAAPDRSRQRRGSHEERANARHRRHPDAFELSRHPRQGHRRNLAARIAGAIGRIGWVAVGPP